MTFNPSSIRLIVLGLIVAITALFLMPESASAQPVANLDLTFGGGKDDFAHAATQARDGGYVVAGETQSFGSGGRDFWLVKTNTSGNELWTRTFGGPGDDVAYAIAQTSDGGLVVAGASAQSSESTTDFYLIKTDSLGIELWSRRYGNLGLPGILNTQANDIAYSVRQTADGGYILAGTTDGQDGRDVWLVRTDANGQKLWDREFGASGTETAFSVQQTTDGGFIAAGGTDSVELASHGGTDFWLLKVSASGEEEWTNTLGGEFNDEARAVVQTTDGGFALAGTTWSKGSGFSDFWLVKTDQYGEEQWNRTHGGVSRDAAYGLQQTLDGGYVLGGWSESFPGGEQFWVVKTDAVGVRQWDVTYGRSSGESSGARAIQQTTDRGYLIAGWTTGTDGERNFRMVKTLPDGVSPTPLKGPVAVLENLGSTEITSAAVAFDTPSGDRPHQFFYQGRFLSRNNHLPANGVACTAPIPGLVDGSRLALDQIRAGEISFIGSVTDELSAPVIQVDHTVMPFDLAYNTATSGSIVGQYSIVSNSPCTSDAPDEEPRSPSGLAVEAPNASTGTLALDWDDNVQLGTTRYNVYVSLAKTGPYGLVAASVAESQYVDSGLKNGTEYYYVVSAVSAQGTESAQSLVTSGIPAERNAPRAPTGLQVTVVDQETGSVQLDWEVNPDTDLGGYDLYRRLNNEGFFSRIAIGIPTSDYLDTNVPRGAEFMYVVSAVDVDGNESARSNIAPLPMDFFGIVLSLGTNAFDERILVLNTNQGRAEVVIVNGTEILVPQAGNAIIADLSPGDNVAVTLTLDNGRLVADQIQVIPSKTKNRHIPGTVTDINPNTQITIKPSGNDEEPITFTLSDSVEVKLHRGITELGVGSFVVVGAVVDAGTGKLLATEIDATSAKRSNLGQFDPTNTENKPKKSVHLKGVFEGINPGNGNLILADVEVRLGVGTKIHSGLVAGDVVEIFAEVLPDESLLALEVERDDSGDEGVSEKTRLNGIFKGVDQPTGRWNISGTLVTVGGSTDTDGIPRLGQRVKVTALLQDDGSLLAREVENEFGQGRPFVNDNETGLEGVFQGTDADGNWIIGGRKVAVGAGTGLEGDPTVGRRVAVEALRNGSNQLLALEIKTEFGDEQETKREANIQGVVDQVLSNGSLIVDGIRITISALTELTTAPRAGDRVDIKALLQENGDFLARQIEADHEDGVDKSDGDANPVDIEGIIEEVNLDGSLVINGIRITISVLSDVEGDLRSGASVQIRGLLSDDGSVLARTVRAEGRRATTSGSETKIRGVAERVNRNVDGSIRSVVVNGLTVAVEALTKIDRDLETGNSVGIEGIINAGRFVANMVAKAEREDVEHEEGNVELEGAIAEVGYNSAGRAVALVINGIEFGIPSSTQLRGSLEVGKVVGITGQFRDGRLTADKVEGKETKAQTVLSIRFEIDGVVKNVARDFRGNVVRLEIGGEKIAIDPLTDGKENATNGNTVTVEGLNQNGILLAATIVPTSLEDRFESDWNNEEERFKGEQETLTESAKQARARAEERAAIARGRAKKAHELENEG